MKVKAFITHKLSESYSECQDRFAINKDKRSIAVSDGMSQSIFPDYWAEILSAHYVEKGQCTEEDRVSLCDDWKSRVNTYLNDEKMAGRNPWRLENNLASFNGAGATICGVTFDKSNHWKGHVLGDSCIVEVDVTDWNNPQLNIYTSEDKAFDCYPDYYESFPQNKGRGFIKEFEGQITATKFLLLMSDPFSEYFYNHKDNPEILKLWIEKICKLKSNEGFCSLVDDWRSKGLHNDDSTLCVVEFDKKLELTITYQDNIDELIKNEKGSTHEELAEQLPESSVAVCQEGQNMIGENSENLSAVPQDEVSEFSAIIKQTGTELFKMLNNLSIKKKKKNKLNDKISKLVGNLQYEFNKLFVGTKK